MTEAGIIKNSFSRGYTIHTYWQLFILFFNIRQARDKTEIDNAHGVEIPLNICNKIEFLSSLIGENHGYPWLNNLLVILNNSLRLLWYVSLSNVILVVSIFFYLYRTILIFWELLFFWQIHRITISQLNSTYFNLTVLFCKELFKI